MRGRLILQRRRTSSICGRGCAPIVMTLMLRRGVRTAAVIVDVDGRFNVHVMRTLRVRQLLFNARLQLGICVINTIILKIRNYN